MQRSVQRGFTLVELLVTIVIIGILASVGLVTYSSAQRSARMSKRIQDLKAIQTAVELFKNSTGAYPVAATNFVCVPAALVPTYMPVLPLDPLSTTATPICYRYRSDDNANYKIRTNVPASENMTAADYNQQPAFLDPGLANTWAVYSGANARTWGP